MFLLNPTLVYTTFPKFSIVLKGKQDFGVLKEVGMVGVACSEVGEVVVILTWPLSKNNKIIKIAFLI